MNLIDYHSKSSESLPPTEPLLQTTKQTPSKHASAKTTAPPPRRHTLKKLPPEFAEFKWWLDSVSMSIKVITHCFMFEGLSYDLLWHSKQLLNEHSTAIYFITCICDATCSTNKNKNAHTVCFFLTPTPMNGKHVAVNENPERSIKKSRVCFGWVGNHLVALRLSSIYSMRKLNVFHKLIQQIQWVLKPSALTAPLPYLNSKTVAGCCSSCHVC